MAKNELRGVSPDRGRDRLDGGQSPATDKKVGGQKPTVVKVPDPKPAPSKPTSQKK